MPWIDESNFVWSHPDEEPTEGDIEAEREIEVKSACHAGTPPRRRKVRIPGQSASVPIATIMKNSSGRIIGCAISR